jgi:UDP-glucose 4-epimerase
MYWRNDRGKGEIAMNEPKKIVFTGVAGFIGSHVAERLIGDGHEVLGIDNLSSGRKEFLEGIISNERFEFRKADILKDDITGLLKGCDTVFHLAANPEVRIGSQDANVHLEQNIIATSRVLEAMREHDVKDIVFTSTSTVYGEADVIPTPEDYGPLMPISLYGSSKLACEAMISAYCHTFGMTGAMFRFANVVGRRSTHGVVYDFVQKLRSNPGKLEILGREPGTKKSYFHVKDCVDGMLFGWQRSKDRVEAYNIGSEDFIDVRTIADTVCEEMHLRNVEYEWMGKDDERGWIGDVRVMLLSIDKIVRMGWKPELASKQSVGLAAREIFEETR